MKLPNIPEKYSILILRALTGIIFFTHGAARIFYDTVPGFGEYLNSQGFMIGLPLAWLVTIGEIICGSLLAFGYKVRYCTIFHAVILVTGIFLIHLPSGWFTVGQNQGGMEYSILLLAVLAFLYSCYSTEKNETVK